MAPRIAPIDPPYAPAVAAQLESMTPPRTAPIALFRTFVHNFDMTEAMTGWGRYELSRHLSVSMRDREIVIHRVCARCGCEYEWGVHVAYFAGRVGLTDRQVASLTFGSSDDPCWTDERERALIAMVDALHDHNDIDDETWRRLTGTLRRAPVARSVAAVRLVPRHQLRRPRRCASISNRARRASATSGAEPHDLRRPPSLPMMRRMPNDSVADRQSVAALHHRLQLELAGPGDWWDGASRRAIMEESRKARHCARCRRGGEREHSSTDTLSAAAVEVIHRVVNDSGNLTRGWAEIQIDELGDARYAELVAVTAIIVAIDVYSRSAGSASTSCSRRSTGHPPRSVPTTSETSARSSR